MRHVCAAIITSTMSVQSREKIALFVFMGLIVLSLSGLGWYLLAGHSWNVAASNIDDTFGSMDGYTAIVYPGTQIPEEPEVPPTDSEEELLGGKVSKDTAVKSEGSSSGDISSNDANAQSASSSSETNPKGGLIAGAQALLTGSSQQDSRKDASDNQSEAASTDESLPLDSATDIEAGSLSKKKVVTVDEAKTSYEAKKATVFALDTENLSLYREGTILKKGSHRFGVFSVETPLSSIVLEKHIAYFKRYAVDFIVVLTKDKAYVEDAEGIDIAICTQDEELFVMGETQNGTFYVDTPEVGRVGAILISPSNVVSAKVIEEL